jgi:hypothetical protein
MLSGRRLQRIVRIKCAALLLTIFTCLALSDANPFAGTWKLNAEKSNSRAPFLLRDGVLRIPSEVFKGGAVSSGGPRNGRGGEVFYFAITPDGRTLTLTQPQTDPNYKVVFERR